MLRALVVVALVCAGSPALSAQEVPRSDGWVVISVDDYRALRLKAYPPEPPPDPPPVQVTLSRVDYALRADGDAIAGAMRLTADVLADGWVEVPVPMGFAVRGARVDGRPVSLVDRGAPRVLLSKRGRVVIELDVAIPTRFAGGNDSLMLPPTEAAVTRVALVVPRRDIDLSVAGGVLVERAADPEKPWVVYGSPVGPTLMLTWKKRTDDARATQPTRIRGHVTQSVGLGEETALVTANVRLEVTQGLASFVNIALPAGLLVNQVSGPLVGDWEFKPGALRVTFLEAVAAQTTLAITAEAAVPREGKVDVPLLRLAGAERENGGVVVEVLGAGEITERQPRALDPADPSDFGAELATRATPSMIAYRFRPQDSSGDRGLTVNVLRYTPQTVLIANVEEARYDALVGEEGKVLVRARYAVRNNQRAFLGLVLPQGATLWSASVASRPLRPGEGPNGGLLIPLLKGRTGEEAPAFVVEITYVQRADAWGDDGRATLTLPAIDLPVSRTGVALHHSPRFRLKPEPGAFRPDVDSGAFSEALRSEDAVAVAAEERGGVPGGVVGGVVGGLPEAPQPPPPPSAPEPASKDESGKLISDFRHRSAGRAISGVVPVRIRFPQFGETLFLASELTPEGRGPSIEFSYKREERW